MAWLLKYEQSGDPNMSGKRVARWGKNKKTRRKKENTNHLMPLRTLCAGTQGVCVCVCVWVCNPKKGRAGILTHLAVGLRHPSPELGTQSPQKASQQPNQTKMNRDPGLTLPLPSPHFRIHNHIAWHRHRVWPPMDSTHTLPHTYTQTTTQKTCTCRVGWSYTYSSPSFELLFRIDFG